MLNIGDKIKKRRKELNMSVDELAKELGKNRATVYRYEKGDIETLPSTVLDRMAKALKTTPQYLIGWRPDPKMQKPTIDHKDIIIGDVIKSLRMNSSMSVEEYSAEIGISADDLKKYENGSKQPPASTIRSIAQTQGINMFDLLEQYLLADNPSPMFTKIHLERSKRWHREFGRFNFTEDELNQIFHYARFVVWTRLNNKKGDSE